MASASVSARAPSSILNDPAAKAALASSRYRCGLFMAQRLGRLGLRDSERLADHGGQRDGGQQCCSSQKVERVQSDPLIEAVQPDPHRQPRHRPGDEVGQQHGAQQLAHEQSQHVGCGGAQRLSDADFLHPPGGVEGRQAVEAYAADAHGQQRAQAEHAPMLVIGPVICGEVLVRRDGAERRVRRYGAPSAAQAVQHGARIA